MDRQLISSPVPPSCVVFAARISVVPQQACLAQGGDHKEGGGGVKCCERTHFFVPSEVVGVCKTVSLQ